MTLLLNILLFVIGIFVILFLWLGIAGDNFDVALLALMLLCLFVQFFDMRAMYVFAGAFMLMLLLDQIWPGTRGGWH